MHVLLNGFIFSAPSFLLHICSKIFLKRLDVIKMTVALDVCMTTDYNLPFYKETITDHVVDKFIG
jgi:hypothetical protein